MISSLKKIVTRPGFWFLLLLMVLITIPHYEESLKHPSFLSQFFVNLGLTRHSFERILYLAPIVWAGFIFGRRGSIITSLVALAAMLPRAIFISPATTDALFETGAVFVLGNVVSFSFEWLRREREYRAHLEVAQRELESHIRIIKENEKRLATLNQISSTVSQSLDLNQVLSSAIDKVVDVMQADFGMVFLLDEVNKELTIATQKGLSEEFVREIGKIKVGEGFNGRVAASGEPLFVEDAAQDPRLTKEVVSKHHIHSEIIVPLRSKDKPNGTLCIGMRHYRQFRQDEVELLAAIGSQIGIAVEKAHLYQQERRIAEQLRVSEQRYRYLFDNASDAIWVHDMRGYIVDANKATERLNGWTKQEFLGKNVKDFLTEDFLNLAREVQSKLLRGEDIEQPYEQRLIRKDGTIRTMKMATSVVIIDGEPHGFQHIARDVTEEKQMQENMRFYLQQVTRAQEEERKRISRELHDETIQDLVVLSRRLDDLASSGTGLSEENIRCLEELRQETNEIIRGVRRLSQDLRPATLDRLGLLPAIEWLAADVTQYSGIATKVNVLGTERRLSEEEELLLFRITQEALRNVWRHSGATSAEVTVEFGEKARITIKDNGKGFAPPRTMGDLARDGKLGLAGMQERTRLLGGSITVQSEPGKGTTVTVEMPG